MSNPGQEATDNKALRELRDAIIDLNVSTKKSSFVMKWLTIILVVLTVILVILTWWIVI